MAGCPMICSLLLCNHTFEQHKLCLFSLLQSCVYMRSAPIAPTQLSHNRRHKGETFTLRRSKYRTDYCTAFSENSPETRAITLLEHLNYGLGMRQALGTSTSGFGIFFIQSRPSSPAIGILVGRNGPSHHLTLSPPSAPATFDL